MVFGVFVVVCLWWCFRCDCIICRIFIFIKDIIMEIAENSDLFSYNMIYIIIILI